MKFSFKALAAAALLALPASAQAQIDTDVSLSIVSHPFKTVGTNYLGNGMGGGFLANFSIDFPKPDGTKNFNNFLVWCIDANRTISVPGGPYTYSAYTALDFANTSLGSPKPYNVSESDIRKIVTVASDLQSKWTKYSESERADRQGSIWALFRGETTPLQSIAETQDISNWVVLYNGENQTFLTNVPEPSSVALLLTVMGGMAFMIIARRRRA